MDDGGAGLAVFRPVGTGKEGLAADSAPLLFLLMKQLSCPAVLGIGHDGDFLFDFHHLLSDCQKTLPIYPYILKAK